MRRWIWPLLIDLERRSQLVPLSNPEVCRFAHALHLVKNLRTWSELVMKSPAEATLEEAVALFSRFESVLRGHAHISPLEASAISRAFRRYVGEFLQSESVDGRMARLSKMYRTVFTCRPEGRALISDIPHASRAPLGAIRHSSFAELQAHTKQTIETDLFRIQEACQDVLTRYERAVAAIESLRKGSIPAEMERSLRARIEFDSRFPSKRTSWDHEETEALLLLLVQVAAGVKPPLVFRDPSVHLAKSELVLPRFREICGGISNGKTLAQLSSLDIAPPAEILLACALTVQIHTCWNFASVIELTRADIAIEKFPHSLQSIKPKTRDHTPKVIVERGDVNVIRALRLLDRRMELLIERGWVAEDEKRIWIGSRLLMTRRIANLTNWGGALQKLQTKYDLPKFSLEQVRVQCLGALQGTRDGLQRAMLAAGHASESTTFGYINKLLLRRQNSANALEFERRLDATVRYMIDPDSVAEDQKLIPYPIGDGSSCRNPHSPPNEAWLDAGICRASECHTASGCPNRLITITQERIEEVVRTRKYYESNWLRLVDENDAAFERVQLPQMLFNFALYGVLGRGPYRHLVSQYEEELSSGTAV
ncbi:hypothetical protein [Variovorax paradoxus]|uniref:hypothetical protein n=1 Tax=Variovorax paradoxus TaxID=34073 RepID=UPI00339324C0